MKIKYSLKHATNEPGKSLVSTELLNDHIYIDLSLNQCIALIIDNHIKWSWCGGDIQYDFDYSLEQQESQGKKFALLPKGTVITFTQEGIE
jgi:hypothetical protein